MLKYFALMVVVSLTTISAEPVYTALYIRNYDGDTVRLMVQVWPDTYRAVNVRLLGIDTPEIRGQCKQEIEAAIEAREYVRATLQAANQIRVASYGLDKYGRMLAEIFVDGNDLGSMLRTNGMARKYDGGKRGPWCDVAS